MGYFRDIAGHEQIRRVLQNALEQKRVSHAYLFTGPTGVGKSTTAQALAQALLCTEYHAGEACGVCPACRRVLHDNHPDCQWLDPTGRSIKIQQIREMQRTIDFRSYLGGHRVTVIRRADSMTPEAANSLLKTLEEPPEDTHFILLTTQPQALPATVISRCQRFSFKALALPLVASFLVANHGVPAQQASLLAALSGGSPGQALEYLSGSLLEKRDQALEVAATLAKAGITEILELAEELAKNRDRALTTLELLLCWYRDLLIWRETQSAELLYNQDRLPELRKEEKSLGGRTLVGIIEEVNKAKNNIGNNSNIRLVLESLFLQIKTNRFTHA